MELLSFATGQPHGWLIGHSEALLSSAQKRRFDRLLALISAKNPPLIYATGETTFCGLKLQVNHHVLIPRPETEILVRQAEKLIEKIPDPRIIDVGTGSGAIAIALADFCHRHGIRSRIVATDSSKRALKLAYRNITTHDLESYIELRHSDLLRNICGTEFDIIVANLPYLSPRDTKELPDPPRALMGGPRGHELMKRLMRQIAQLEYQPRYLALEIGYNQGSTIRGLARNILKNARTKIIQDLNGWDRVALVTLDAPPT